MGALPLLILTVLLHTFAGPVSASAQYAPAIISQPQSQTVRADEYVEFTARVSNTASNLLYLEQGYLPSTNTLDALTNAGTLYFDYDFLFVPDELRVYYNGVMLTNTGYISGVGRLEIPFGPGPSTRVSIVIDEGNPIFGTVYFYTASFNPEKLSLQWRHNNVDLPGGTEIYYSISSSKDTNAGAYTLVASNSFGVVTSAVATLTVTYPLYIARYGSAPGAPVILDLSWPVSFGPYTLQESSSITPLSWSPVLERDYSNQVSHRVLVTNTVPHRFFRLNRAAP